ncbi:MAG: ABC transporter permease subunit, partial [Pseudomonas sp.]|nr:ABC transporter permease subunit [Pseudomonas sp.]
PAGQLEAATAYGLSRAQRFALVLFPQLMRFALPGLGNNWLVLLKSTALVWIIGLSDLVKAAQNAGKSTSEPLYFLILAGLVYLVITSLSNRIFKRLERRYNLGIKGMAR